MSRRAGCARWRGANRLSWRNFRSAPPFCFDFRRRRNAETELTLPMDFVPVLTDERMAILGWLTSVILDRMLFIAGTD